MINSIDENTIQGEIVLSKKYNKLTPYVGNVVLYLCRTKLSYKEMDVMYGDLVLNVTEKITKYIKGTGKLKVKGFTPKQTIAYLRQLVHFSYLETRSFVMNPQGRAVKHRMVETVPYDKLVHDVQDYDPWVMSDIEAEIDYKDALDWEIRYWDVNNDN